MSSRQKRRKWYKIQEKNRKTKIEEKKIIELIPRFDILPYEMILKVLEYYCEKISDICTIRSVNTVFNRLVHQENYSRNIFCTFESPLCKVPLLSKTYRLFSEEDMKFQVKSFSDFIRCKRLVKIQLSKYKQFHRIGRISFWHWKRFITLYILLVIFPVSWFINVIGCFLFILEYDDPYRRFRLEKTMLICFGVLLLVQIIVISTQYLIEPCFKLYSQTGCFPFFRNWRLLEKKESAYDVNIRIIRRTLYVIMGYVVGFLIAYFLKKQFGKTWGYLVIVAVHFGWVVVLSMELVEKLFQKKIILYTFVYFYYFNNLAVLFFTERNLACFCLVIVVGIGLLFTKPAFQTIFSEKKSNFIYMKKQFLLVQDILCNTRKTE